MEIEPKKKTKYYYLKENNQNMVIDSFCTNCHKQGKTRVLLTDIPFFKCKNHFKFPNYLRSCNLGIFL